jgi:hypothetical protein
MNFDSCVAELQGLDGAFSFAELLLQRIWARLEFDHARACTVAGEPIRLLDVGRWNRLGGPDFLDARIEIGGRRVFGDIEVHLRARDWEAHRHADDMAYSRVVLHVVLFPTFAKATRSWDGAEIPILVLLPLLNRSLEEYAEDDAIERLANHPLSKARDALLALPLATQRAELKTLARQRWERKVMWAALRIDRLGWREACHHTALEILGYRFNRAPMLRIAEAWPLSEWTGADQFALKHGLIPNHQLIPEHPLIPDRAFASEATHWQRQAIRPANFPQARLRQYARWVAAEPDWPNRLSEFAETLPKSVNAEHETARFRRTYNCPTLWRELSRRVTASAISGPRLHTLISDGFWPLLAAEFPKRAALFEAFWMHSYPGDLPERLREIAQALSASDPALRPFAHGIAQGLLGWCSRGSKMHQAV